MLSRDHGRPLAYTVLGAGALSAGFFAAWHELPQRPTPAPVLAEAAQPTPGPNPYGPMVVGLGPWARSATATAPALEQSAALDAKIESAAPRDNVEPTPSDIAQGAEEEGAPLPPRRPAELKNSMSHASEPAPMRQAALPSEPAPAPADNRSFFEKVFGGAGAEQQQAAQPQPALGRGARRQQQAVAAPGQTQALAYAPQETTGGLFGGLTSAVAPSVPAQSTAAARPGAGTAVYDISAHTVYMPDGTKLEAHSGLGQHLDDPRFVHIRMKGPTPPSIYALSPREALFHGVEALRLTPVGGNNIYGRAGLLAHTFMLGPNGDSNGCVSFRDYNAFLQAYKRGDVRRLVVVARM
ncbi:DUF2778 domain-containing protein [Methylocystis sp. MJC1]|jgi:hypothetical protein|nr:DUF2778 domain-containing protein [Methylocystis sp. MJC1]MBU6526021.1 DUF2778 domain-containing protein [Methylocystis sp. MJC1]UZX12488.1 DUF2778 domain-containing protein [Methylocystis sp. MJC1]